MHRSDLETLNNRRWLNDTAIGFAYDVFSAKFSANEQNMLFVHPTTVNVIKFENDIEDLVPLITDSGIPDHDFLFFPINNSNAMFSVGGSHWALLLYQRHNNTFYYVDSIEGSNRAQAKAFANKIYPFIDGKTGSAEQEEEEEEEEHADDEKKEDHGAEDKGHGTDYVKVVDNFVTLRVPQQENGYDCGMFVVEYTAFTANYLTGSVAAKGADVEDTDCPSAANAPFFKTEVDFDSGFMVRMRKKWRETIKAMQGVDAMERVQWIKDTL